MQACLASNVCGWQAALDGKQVYSGNALKKPPYIYNIYKGYGLRVAQFHPKSLSRGKPLALVKGFRFLGGPLRFTVIPWH